MCYNVELLLTTIPRTRDTRIRFIFERKVFAIMFVIECHLIETAYQKFKEKFGFEPPWDIMATWEAEFYLWLYKHVMNYPPQG